MICYNCSTENPDDQKCCSNCGCTLHRIINEKHSVVISMEQQREIGNYKSKSSYKIAQPTQEEILQNEVKMSHTPFAAQNTSKGSSDKAQKMGEKFLTARKRVNLDKEKLFRPDQVKSFDYTSPDRDNIPTTAVVTQNHSKRVNLKKKENAPGSGQGSDGYKTYSGYSPHAENFNPNYNYETGDYSSPVRHIGEYTVIEPGLTKQQFLKLPYLSDARMPYFYSLVLSYACCLGQTIFFCSLSQWIGLIGMFIYLLLIYGVQFRMSKRCAQYIMVLSLFIIFVEMIVNQDIIFLFSCVGSLICGAVATKGIINFEKLWEQYQTTGMISRNGVEW